MDLNLDHLRLALDELEHRADAVRQPGERRHLLLDVVTLERKLALAEARGDEHGAHIERLRHRLRRLHAAA